MSYAQTVLSSLFMQKPFILSAEPGLWILSTTDSVGTTCIVFSSCTVPTVYMASGVSYWFASSSRDWSVVNWANCVGPEPPLPAFPWAGGVPTFTELVTYLHDNRFAGPCEGGGGGGGSMQTIYSGNGELAGNRLVDFKDKTLIFWPSLAGSAFAISRDGGAFPPVSLNQLAFRFDPDDFLGTGKPGLVFGYQNIPGGSGGESTGIQLSQVTGQKAILMTSIDEANNKFNTIIMNDDEINLNSIGNLGSTNFKVQPGRTLLDGIPNLSKPDVLYYDSATKDITYAPLSVTPPSNALFAVSTQAAMVIPNPGNQQIPCSGTVFQVDTTKGNYNYTGFELDLTTGVYSPSQTAEFEIVAQSIVQSVGVSGQYNLNFYNVTDGVQMFSSTCVIDNTYVTLGTCSLIARGILEAAKLYVFRISSNIVNPLLNMPQGHFSINKI